MDGRPGRLEIATPAGLLTLHPEADGLSAHGNVVGPDGVRPLAYEWSPRHWFESRQGPLVAAAAGLDGATETCAWAGSTRRSRRTVCP